MKNKYFCISLIIFICASTCFSQTQKQIDSVEAVISASTNDSSKLIAINTYTSYIVDFNPQKSIRYSQLAFEIAQKAGFKSYEATALNSIGNGYYNLADFKTCLEYYLKALRIQENLNNKKGVLSSTGSIGNVLLALKKPTEAILYFNRALKISYEINNENAIASCLISIGTCYSDKREFKKSLNFYFESLELFLKVNNEDAIATNYNNIGDNYFELKEYSKSLLYLTKALNLSEKTGNTYSQSLSLNNIGDFYYEVGDESKAIDYYNRSLGKSKVIQANEHILASYKGLAKAYKKKGDYQLALNFHELFKEMNDSIFNLESSHQILEMQGRFDSEKKEQEIAILTKDKKIQEDALELQTLISKSIIGVGILLLLLTGVAIRGFVNKRKANRELGLKNEKIENAYSIIEYQHKDIKDSIEYAKRIQETILPQQTIIKELLPDSFILYRPKDVVSGDFYWVEPWGNEVLFAAVDCTGHGVPGALMSVVGVNLLNKALNELGLSKPALILNSLSKGIGKTLRQTGMNSEIKDGMDLALCSIDFKNKKLEYAGVFNPLWIIRNGKILETASDKNPIGSYMDIHSKNYTNHEINLQKGDSIYIFTDGYADQFGGPKGKKYKYKALQALLLSIQDKSMMEQLDVLNSNLDNWQGALEQVDDILVIGVRV